MGPGVGGVEALRLEAVSKEFGGVLALADLSLTVESGQRLGVIGPNGAGKTTLFNVLNGQLSPTRGRVFLFGQDITGMTINRRAHLGLGRSFQVTSLFSNLTVVRNMLLALNGTDSRRFQIVRSMKSYHEVFDAAEAVLRAWDLWGQKDELVLNLSYGEQRRLEIAASMASQPRLLLLDEPSAGLTAAESAEVIERIRGLGGEVTVILVAHDMDLVFGVAERIIVMHYGKIIADGTMDQIQADSRVKEVYMGSGEFGDDSSAP